MFGSIHLHFFLSCICVRFARALTYELKVFGAFNLVFACQGGGQCIKINFNYKIKKIKFIIRYPLSWEKKNEVKLKQVKRAFQCQSIFAKETSLNPPKDLTIKYYACTITYKYFFP